MVERERFESIVQAAGGRIRPLCIETCGSTNDECARLARDGAAECLVVIADSQTAGRGRFDRTWISPPGGNLYMSMLVRPQPSAFSLQPPDWCALGLVASLSVLDAVERALPPLTPHASRFMPVLLKWPNDLLVGTRKFCGILSTAGTDARGEPFAVAGIGVNLNAVPPGLNGSAAALRDFSGGDIDVTVFAAGVAAGFFRRLNAACAHRFDDMFREWERRSGWLGREVTVATGAPGLPGESKAGTAVGLGPHGALRIKLPDGRIEEVVAGDASIGTGRHEA